MRLSKLLFLAMAGFLLFPSFALGQTYYTMVRYREHATDCTSLTDGKKEDVCWELDDGVYYKCVPSSGDCDTPGEWVQFSGAGASISDAAYGGDWNGDTTNAASKNAIYDKIESLAGGHDALTLDANADTLLSLSTQELGLDTQTANYIFAGPTTGGAAVPTFRTLVAADIPDLSGSYQVADSDLTTYAGITPSANVQSLLGAADYAAMRGLLDLEAGTDFYSMSAADAAFEGELDNSAGLRGALSDETGTGAAVFAGGNIGAATATTPSANDNDTSVATTAYVQTEINGSGGRSLSCSGGSCEADAELYSFEKSTWFEDPAVEEMADFFLGFMSDFTLTFVKCKTDTGTVSINLEDGSDNNILSAELVCDSDGQTSCSSGCDVNTINGSYDNITAKTEDIDLDISATASSPTRLSIMIGGTVDD